MDHHHNFWWRFFPKKELTQIYFSAALRSFAVSLLSIFLPLYLYKEMGYSFNQTILFFILYSVVFAIFCPLGAKFASRFGTKHSVLVSIPFYLAFLFLLYNLSTFKVPLFVLSFLVGIYLAFYWMGMHLVFHHASDYEHRGKEVGIRQGVIILSTLFGPLVGGFLIKYVGFKIVFIIASIMLFLAAFVLFFSKENKVKYNFSIRSLIDKKHWENSLFFVSRGSRVMAAGVIWPLFIFFILNDYFSLGIVESLAAGITAFLILITGRYSDKVSKRGIIGVIAGFEGLSWFLRAAISTITQVYGITIFGAITYGIFEAPVGAMEYDKAKNNIVGYFVGREIYICLGRILVLLIVLMTNSLSSGLIFNGLATFTALLF